MIKDNLNNLRAWAILGVIVIHITAKFTKLTEFSWLPVTLASIDIYAHFAVPLFVAVSGFVLALRYDGNYKISVFYKKRLKRIFFPFVIWSFLYILLSPGRFKDPFQVIFDIFTGRSYYHLWFFFLILQLYLIFPYLRKQMKSNGIKFLIISFTFQLFYWLSMEFIKGSDNLSVLIKGIFFSDIFYFCFGIWASDNLLRVENFIKKLPRIFSSSIFVSTILISFILSYNWLAYHNGFFDKVPSYIVTEKALLPFIFILIFINLILLSDSIKSKQINIALDTLSKLSFGIYLSHAIVLRAVVKLLSVTNIHLNDPIFYPLAFIITTMVSLIFCLITERTPLSKYLLGLDRLKNIT